MKPVQADPVTTQILMNVLRCERTKIDDNLFVYYSENPQIVALVDALNREAIIYDNDQASEEGIFELLNSTSLPETLRHEISKLKAIMCILIMSREVEP